LRRFFRHTLLALFTSCLSLPAAQAAPRQGEGLQTDGLSTSLVSRDFTDETSASLATAFNLSEVVGLHYYFVDRVRVGMSLQLTERVVPEPEPGSSRLQRVAFMPQLGYNFSDLFYTAVIFSYAPRTRGRAIPDLALTAVLGAGFSLADGVRFSVALEAPWAFHYHQTLGVVVYSGLGFRL
jgi:hypothetical protein